MDRVDAVSFDLDGVMIDTAAVHAAAWRRIFDRFWRTDQGVRRRTTVPRRPALVISLDRSGHGRELREPGANTLVGDLSDVRVAAIAREG